MIAGMNKSGKYGAELKFSVKSMDVMKVMVKSDSKSSNDALKGTMAQIKGEDYTDLQADAPDIKETNTIMESLDAIENLKADFWYRITTACIIILRDGISQLLLGVPSFCI